MEEVLDERAEAEAAEEAGYYAVMHSTNLRWMLQMAADGADVEELMVDFELDTVDVPVE